MNTKKPNHNPSAFSGKRNSSPEKGLTFKRYYTRKGKSPFDQFNYIKHSSAINSQKGDQLFSIQEVEVPENWSQLATDILAQKYFRKSGVPQADGSEGSETSIKQVVHRLVDCWRHWGEKYGYFAGKEDAQTFYDELV